MVFSSPEINLPGVLPEIILIVGAAAALFLSSPKPGNRSFSGSAGAACLWACAVICASMLSSFLFPGPGSKSFGGLMDKGGITLLFLALMDISCLLAIVLSSKYEVKSPDGCEYHSLILFALAGMHIMAAGRDLLVIFLGLEILAMPIYVLVGFEKKKRAGMEGAVKYFLLGSFSSALFLLGLALYYGAAGTTALQAASSAVTSHALLFAGLAFVIAGVGFKIAAVPFHMWAPDAYEGAPVPVAAFISVAPKIAAFAVLLRFATEIPGGLLSFFAPAIIIMSVGSMIIGNLSALRQSGLVRMLAYSGIAQAGYILIGLLPPAGAGGAAVSFYLLVYLFMNIGAFAIAVALTGGDAGRTRIEDLSGLASRRPYLAFSMAVFMISLAGLPPTGGFLAKFYLFKAGIEAGYLSVVIVAIVMTAVSLFYYLRVIITMYTGPAEDQRAGAGRLQVLNAVIASTVFIVFLTGILPGGILHSIQKLLGA